MLLIRNNLFCLIPNATLDDTKLYEDDIQVTLYRINFNACDKDANEYGHTESVHYEERGL